jgi:hypothetical protein
LEAFDRLEGRVDVADNPTPISRDTLAGFEGSLR